MYVSHFLNLFIFKIVLLDMEKWGACLFRPCICTYVHRLQENYHMLHIIAAKCYSYANKHLVRQKQKGGAIGISMGIRIFYWQIHLHSPTVVHLIIASLGWIKSPKLRRFKSFINLVHTIYVRGCEN
jgi:hypothetical protein